VKNGKMKWDRYEFISLETHNTLSKYNKPKVGDILYSRVGAGFGDAAIVDKYVEFSIFVSLTLLKVKPVVLNEFLCYYLNSPLIKEVARKNITGTGVGNLNVGAVRLFNIKLPDLKTQNEIVKKLNNISQNGEIFIGSYFKKLEQLSLLKQSILRQAFNGELVKE
jgi:type I restriction enzyme S subunit